MRPLRFALCLSLALATFATACHAQLTTAEEKGLPPNSALQTGDVDVVNLQNGNLHIAIPIYSETQRGGQTLKWTLLYDSPTWVKQWQPNNCGTFHCVPLGQYTVVPHPSVVAGWRLSDPSNWQVNYTFTDDVLCPGTGLTYGTNTNWAIIDPDGTSHPLPLRQEVSGTCNGETLKGPTLDGSGMVYDFASNTILLKDGTQIVPSITSSGKMRDANGNLFTFSDRRDANGRTPVAIANAANVTFTTPNGTHLIYPQYTTYTVNDSNGNPHTYRVDYQAIDMTSNSCGWSLTPGSSSPYTCTESYQPSIQPASVTLPDGRAYIFTFNNNSPGELASLSLPTGASIAYSYGDFYQLQYQSHGAQGNFAGGRAVIGRRVTVDGTPQPWTYSISNIQTVVTDPAGNTTTHAWGNITVTSGGATRASPNAFELSVIYKNSAGTTLRTVTNDYTGELDTVNNSTANIRPYRETTTLENGQQSKTETDFETFTYTCTVCTGGSGVATRLNPVEKREYDYGTTSPGALLKRTNYTYLHASDSTYVNLNIVAKPMSVSIYDGAGNLSGQSSYEYDNYSHSGQSFSSSGAIQHDSSYGTGFTKRGNVTASSLWRNTSGTYATTTNGYDDAGNLISSIDPDGRMTTYDYTDSWANSACVPSSGGTKAFATKVTNAKGQYATAVYNACTGSKASSTDANSSTTTTTYDFMGRPRAISFPDGGSKSFCYSDDTSGGCAGSTLYVTETDAINSSSSTVKKTVYDGLGRVKEIQTTSDADGTVYVDTKYDLDGRVWKVSNPYRDGDTVYWTVSGYDGLGRLLTVTKTDGSSTSTSYSGNITLSTDEAGNQRKSQTDVLGRLTNVWEDPNTLNYETDYVYNVMGDLLKVTQKGGDSNSANWRIRTFTYDSLRHLLCSANPEIGSPLAAVATCPVADSGSYIAGTVRYSYTNAGDLLSKVAPLANQTGLSTVTTTYTYDVLHRLTGKSYSDGTASASYVYDGDTPSSPCVAPSFRAPVTSGSNLIGRMSVMCDGSGATAWSYDALGRTTIEARRIGTVTDQVGYSYYLNGVVNVMTYPKAGATTPFSVAYHQNSAGRVDSVTGSDGVTYAQVASTWASGAAHRWQLGTNVQLEAVYNSRLQPSITTATQISTSNTLFSQAYNFHEGSGDNGNLFGVTDGMDSLGLDRPNGSVQYTYDALNRISSAATLGTDCTVKAGGTKDWGTSYNVDAWSNLIGKTVTKCTAFAMSSSSNNRNRLAAADYDSAGNVVTKDSVSYTYDAEGRVTVGAGTAYAYDGSGERVKKPGKLYWKGSGSTAVMETDESDLNPTRYVFFNGARIARVDPGTSSAKYYLTDNLGSTAIVADASGNVLNESLFFPYGQERVIANADTGNNYRYTGKERDPETGLDDFGARYYASNIGRFMTPDWDAKPVTVPYASFGDPQTLNLYSYVQNAPLNKVDADGHFATGTQYLMAPRNLQACGYTGDSMDGCTVADLTVHNKSPETFVADADAEYGQHAPSPPATTAASQPAAAGQQQPNPATGRQPDGSYVAPTGPGSDIAKATDPAKRPSLIGNGQCVTACKHFSGITAPTTSWRRGAAVSGNRSLPIGTAIATFGKNGRYPTGNDKNSGIYMGQGKNGSILILDQWPAHPASGTPAHGAQIREMQFNDGSTMSNSAKDYHVIIVP